MGSEMCIRDRINIVSKDCTDTGRSHRTNFHEANLVRANTQGCNLDGCVLENAIRDN